MNYEYRRRDLDELCAIADNIHRLHARRLRGLIFDIEGLVEEVGFDVIYRPWQELVHGFVPAQLGLIVVREALATSEADLRWTLAEEFCHVVLEFELWKAPTIPFGAAAHSLTDDQRLAIEADAKILASELLMHRRPFTERFNQRDQETGDMSDEDRWPVIRRELAKDFNVPWRFIGKRMVHLNLISPADYARYCPVVM